ncbi:MAG: glycosyltransferase [Oricola sp.]
MKKPARTQAVSVAIASIGRPSLAGTLRSLARVSLPAGIDLSVVVADDSRDGAATRLVKGLDLGCLPVTCLPVASANISSARNALLDAVPGGWLIFVDDDEWVERDWLERLFACQRDFRADVVIGPVIPDYPEDTPAWLVRANPLFMNWGHRGKRLTTGRGGNTLVRMDMVRRFGLRFDPALGLTGGEDTAFFAEAAALGAVIVATDDAIAREHVPAERLLPSYILSRARRAGQSYANMRMAGADAGRRVPVALDALAKCSVAGLAMLVLRPFDRAASFRMRQKFALNRGKLRAVFGLPLAELYRQPA